VQEEFNSDIPQKANLMTWDKYCEKTKLLGFTSGKFMKPDCPVPEGEGYFGIGEKMTKCGELVMCLWYI